MEKDVQQKLAGITSSLRELQKTAGVQQEPRLRAFADPGAERLCKGEKTLVVHARRLDIADSPLQLVWDERHYGTLVLGAPRPISLAEFRRTLDKHGVTEDERKAWWPRARRLYAYPVKSVEALPEPRPFRRQRAGWPPAPDPLSLPQDVVQHIGALGRQLVTTAPGFVEQVLRLCAPSPQAAALLARFASLGPMLTRTFHGKARPSSENPLLIAERLLGPIERLHEITGADLFREVALHLHKILQLDGMLDDGVVLKSFIPLDGVRWDGLFVETETGRAACTTDTAGPPVTKYEAPEGRLPTLKVPQPDFNIQRLRDGQSTGLLSRLRRVERVGEPQFLLNEIGDAYDGQYIWGVVAMQAPVPYKSLADLPDELRNGIDPATREEYSTESPIYYLQLTLVAAYNKPLRLASPIRARRYGPVIEIPAALAKNDLYEEGADVVVGTAADTAAITFRGLTPAQLRELSDQQLRELHAIGAALLQHEFTDGRTSLGGLSREDVENALAFIREEAKRRGLELDDGPELSADIYKGWQVASSRYAPIRPGSRGVLPPIGLDEVLDHMHEEFLIRSPFIYLIGSTANHGRTQNDIDILIRGPLDEVTTHVVKFRLGRMLPPKLAERVSFHGGYVEDAESAISSAGPFGAHLPIYDLVVRRRRDYRTRLEMRDAGLIPEAIESLVAKANPFLDLPEKEQPYGGVLQLHFRGRSVHADLRVGGADDYLIGYTLAVQIPGRVPEPESLAEARKYANSFSPDGSDWNKPFRAPDRVFAATKAPEPKDWETVEEEFGPGSVGATRFKPGYMVIAARPRVSWGERTPYFHEYFLERDPKLSGLLVFRMLVSDEGRVNDPEVEAGRQSPRGVPFWTAMLAKSLLPSVLKPRAVEMGRIPPQGWAYLPPKLKAVVPKQFQYWLPSDEKERLGIRDALVKEGFFTESNIRLVNHEFRRVVTKYYLYTTDKTEAEPVRLDAEPATTGPDSILYPPILLAPPTATDPRPASQICQEKSDADRQEKGDGEKTKTVPFTLSWQRWKGQQVIRAAPSRQVFHLFVQRGTTVEDFQLQDDPLEVAETAATRRVITGDGARNWMTREGRVPPGSSMNPTKNTESVIRIMARGTLTFERDEAQAKRFKISGQGELSGTYELTAEQPGVGAVWLWRRVDDEQTKVGSRDEAVPLVTGVAGRSHRHYHMAQVDGQGNGKTTMVIGRADEHVHTIRWHKVQPAQGHLHDAPAGHTHALPAIEKREVTRTIVLADGTKLTGVQVWDPRNMRHDDDKTGDRERLRPLALYAPMKTAARTSNEFRTGELERITKDFATPAMLATGIVVEPKYNGFRISLQKDSDGRLLGITEDLWERKTRISNVLEALPKLREALDAIPGPYILDGEFMAVTADGDPVPRRELAEFRAGNGDDSAVRVHVFDILYHPENGNVVALPLADRQKLLRSLLEKATGDSLVLVPYRLVFDEKELYKAIEWARRQPGSEGAMLKSAESTITLYETDSWAKVKTVREVFGVVWDRHPVKGSPGVYNLSYAVGPVTEDEASGWAELVEIDRKSHVKSYVKAGRTFNTRVPAEVGDVVRIEVTELLWDETNPKRKRLRGFTPVVIDVADREPSSLAEIYALLGPDEVKKDASATSDVLAKTMAINHREVRIVKQSEERYVLGVVLVPDEYDSQGDIYDHETVRKAAHWFMEEAQVLGLQHQTQLGRDRVRILESYIAPHDLTIEGTFVKGGTWLMAARVLDDALWAACKDGRLTGWSIEGYALAARLD